MYWFDLHFQLVDSMKTQFWIASILERKDSKECILVINIYGLVLYGEKYEFWDSLNSIKAKEGYSNCIMGGDFNTILRS